MSAYNLLIPFISGCCWLVCMCSCVRMCPCVYEGVFVKDRWGWVVVCLCVGNESISFTLVSSPDRGGRAPHALVASPFPSSFFLSVFPHMLVAFCRYRSLSHLSHTLPILYFATYLCIITLYLKRQSLAVHLFTLNFYLCPFSIILSIFISPTFTQNPL